MAAELSEFFQWYDYLIFSITLLIALGIGFYFAFCGTRQRSLEEYFVGNRQLGAFPTGASITLSIISAILVLGAVAEVYLHGTDKNIGQIGIVLGMMTAVYLYVPLFYRLHITSLFEVGLL